MQQAALTASCLKRKRYAILGDAPHTAFPSKEALIAPLGLSATRPGPMSPHTMKRPPMWKGSKYDQLKVGSGDGFDVKRNNLSLEAINELHTAHINTHFFWLKHMILYNNESKFAPI